jgi:hypothetical protein
MAGARPVHLYSVPRIAVRYLPGPMMLRHEYAIPRMQDVIRRRTARRQSEKLKTEVSKAL